MDRRGKTIAAGIGSAGTLRRILRGGGVRYTDAPDLEPDRPT